MQTIARLARGAARRLRALTHRTPGPEREAVATRVYDDAASPEVARRIDELAERNRTSTRSIVDPTSPVTVTMTSHGRRVDRAWTALESIADGAALPARIVLSLSPTDARGIGPELQRLVARGLEVLEVEQQLGVHTKWYPISEDLETPLVTSDDDQLYPRDWLADLIRVHREHPDDVVVHRAHVIGLTDDEVDPYLRWHPCMTVEPSPRHFGTSVSGQLFPVAVHRAGRASGTRFLEVAPSNDDIWLHAAALEIGASVRQVRPAPANYDFVPDTQIEGLYQGNVMGGRNDEQMAATYGAVALARLRAGR
ncbi:MULTISPECIES: hypothetical protein [unclassified Agrococcus]|uniref:hypothetical protein n=1 Tax=unclassified Agrococcus TaxID=2615065 RepID=UPI003610013B